MSGFYGADTDQLRGHSELLRNRARTLTDLRERLQPFVMDESIWQGPDADAFRSTWSTRTAPLFDQVAGQVIQKGEDLDTHAEQQDVASSSGSESEGGDHAEGWDWPALRHRLSDGFGLYNDLQGLFSKGKKVWDIMKIIRRSTDFIGSAEDMFQFAAGTWKYGRDIVDNVFGTGKEFSRLASTIAGKLGLPTGFGPKGFFSWVDNAVGALSGKMPFLTKVAPFLGKALPVVDIGFGGWNLYEGIRDGDTVQAITGGASVLGGGLMVAGGAISASGVGAIVGGPMVAAGAIISGASALTTLVHDNWPAISETAGQAWNWVSDTAGSAWESTTSAISDGLDTVTDTISEGWDNLTGAFGF